MGSTALRFKGLKSLPDTGETKISEAKFFKKLFETIIAGDYVSVDMAFNAVPPEAFNTKENDTVVWLEHNLNYPTSHMATTEYWTTFIETLKNAPVLEIADDWDYTVTDAKRRYMQIKAHYNNDNVL